ncbi:MAG TPA: damage-inducible protein [Roseomonas sp.]|jgi:protein ImuA
MDRRAVMAALRARMARIERAGLADREEPPTIPLCPEMDRDLPGGGLARAALHEILSDGAGAAAGFAALLMARSGGTVFWIARDPCPPGLMQFGLPPSRLITAKPSNHADALWATEEALRCPAVSAVLLMAERPDATAMRRLQLAAETGGGIGLLLRDSDEDEGPSLATTRWRVTGRAGGSMHDLGDPQWTLDLLRRRADRPRTWHVTWRAGMESLVLDDEAREEEAPRRAGRY